jgi:hypothetical protein
MEVKYQVLMINSNNYDINNVDMEWYYSEPLFFLNKEIIEYERTNFLDPRSQSELKDLIYKIGKEHNLKIKIDENFKLCKIWCELINIDVNRGNFLFIKKHYGNNWELIYEDQLKMTKIFNLNYSGKSAQLRC